MATWLLRKFCSPVISDALEGDLLERYQGRSNTWYWRQVVFAIAAGFWQDVRSHKLQAGLVFLLGNLMIAVAPAYYAVLLFEYTGHPLPSTDGDPYIFDVSLQALYISVGIAMGWWAARVGVSEKTSISLVLLLAATSAVFVASTAVNSDEFAVYFSFNDAPLWMALLRAFSVLVGGLLGTPRSSQPGLST